MLPGGEVGGGLVGGGLVGGGLVGGWLVGGGLVGGVVPESVTVMSSKRALAYPVNRPTRPAVMAVLVALPTRAPSR